MAWPALKGLSLVELSNSQYLEFVQNRLKLPPGKRKAYLEQVDTLIERRSLARYTGVAAGGDRHRKGVAAVLARGM